MSLIEAVRSGNLDRVNAEIAAGADVNLPAGDTTPLVVAAAAGRKDIVCALESVVILFYYFAYRVN